MKEKFIDKRMSSDKLELITVANSIINEYLVQGYRMTLRQLFYQFVSRALIPNSKESYSKLGDVISDGRLCGLIDWDAIEDRQRRPIEQQDWTNLSDLVDAAFRTFRLPRWQGQPRYVELWVEKEALAGVLAPLADEYHVTLMVNRGYSSQSAMYESAKRYLSACLGVDRLSCSACGGTGTCPICGGDGIDCTPDGSPSSANMCGGSGKCTGCGGDAEKSERLKEPILFYLGDHDPSGEHMVQDIKDRMVMFGVRGIRVIKLALTMRQVERYNPPPNPVKLTDSRAAAYIEKYGDECWEVDALPPPVLASIIRDAFDRMIDKPMMDAIIAKEDTDKAKLRKAIAALE